MINFSAISNNSLIGRFLRGTLKLIPKDAVLPILQGRLKGRKWIIGSGVFGYWLGTYELEQVKVFEKEIKKGDIVFDIGANVGFYSLLAAELVGEDGKVFAFEPLEENFTYLKKHIEMNNYKNIYPFKVAVTDKSEFALFKKGKSTATSHLDNEGINVKTISIDDWIKSGRLPTPNFLKIDVEGAETLVLNGSQLVIRKHHPSIFLSLHGEIARKECFEILNDFGYDLKLTDDLSIPQDYLFLNF